MNSVIIETHNEDGVEWGVSLTDHNPKIENYIGCKDYESANRLHQLFKVLPPLIWDGSSELANVFFGEDYMKDWDYVSKKSLDIIVEGKIIKVGDQIT
jgi:hypothetical protein